MSETVVLAIHYQNENCHPDGKVKIGMAENAESWRQRTLAAAKKLLAGARTNEVPIIHIRLAVRADFQEVEPNAPIYQQWLDLGAWQDGTWGADFIEGLGPVGDELIVTHIRNNAFYGSNLQIYLDRFQANHLVIAGVSTAFAVDHATRHAADAGYRVTIAKDACQTTTIVAHEAALATLSQFAEIKSVDDIVEAFSPSG